MPTRRKVEWQAKTASAAKKRSPVSESSLARLGGAESGAAVARARVSALSGGFLPRTWSRDRHVRLFLREAGRFAGGSVHESVRLAPGTRVARLSAPVLHESYRSIGEYVERMNRYTDLAAADLAAKGARFRPWRMLLSPPLTFLKLYVLRLGFLDGVRGYVVAAGSAYYVVVKHAKHWERTRTADEESVNPRTADAPAAPAERR